MQGSGKAEKFENTVQLVGKMVDSSGGYAAGVWIEAVGSREDATFKSL